MDMTERCEGRSW